MFRRLLSLLLVSLMLANHGLIMAHVHAVESGDHALRPHFHTGGHGSHAAHSHDSHGKCHHVADRDIAPNVSLLGDRDAHDSDAVYCAENDALIQTNRVVSVDFGKALFASAIFGVPQLSESGLLESDRLSCQPALFTYGICPIYLRTHSLRI